LCESLAVDYVSPESASVARSWEQKFREAREMAGIIFVAVDPTPTASGVSGEFSITLGISRDRPFDDSTIQGIIFKILEREVQSGLYQIRANIYRGVSGACHKGDEGSGKAPP
jgi:hypothetical protein